MKTIDLIKKFWKRNFIGRSIVSADYGNRKMTVEWDDGTKNEYYGSCTVWYELPLMKKCNVSTELMLCEMWEYNIHWQGPYPKAHTKSEIENVVDGIINELDGNK